MLIEILLLNSRPCSTYELPNPSRGPLSVSVVLFFSSQKGKSEPKHDFVLPGGLEDDDSYLFFCQMNKRWGEGLKR